MCNLFTRIVPNYITVAIKESFSRPKEIYLLLEGVINDCTYNVAVINFIQLMTPSHLTKQKKKKPEF